MKPQHPYLSFLRRRFALPASAEPMVEAVLAAEADGGTACRWEGELPAKSAAWIGSAENADAVRVGHYPLVWRPWQGGIYVQRMRWWRTEQELAAAWRARAARQNTALFDPAWAAELLPGMAADAPQWRALECAVNRSLAIITGGPGTGKTFILARILAVLLRTGELSPGEIALAAPTGKAAERMRSAISEAAAGLPRGWETTAEELRAVGERAKTLHALLGYHPGSGTVRFDERHPAPWRVLVVDEASMVEASLWQALLRALAPSARLVVLGDPWQLESVGPGQVLADLVRVTASGGGGWDGVQVELTEARRFAGRPGIVGLAEALRQADGEAAVGWLEAARESGGSAKARGLRWVEWGEERPFPLAQLPSDVWESLCAIGAAEDPTTAWQRMSQIGLLTAHREFAVGARSVSANIEAELRHRGAVKNQPIVVLHNDPVTGLRNGSLGVLHQQGAPPVWRAFFPNGQGGADAEGGVRSFGLAALPEYGSAWCSTVHRAQGSEFAKVVVFVPRRESPLATRELLYTAITRAREEVILIGGADAVRAAAAAGSGRVTLLEAALRAENTSPRDD